MENQIVFSSGEEMLSVLQHADLYSPELEMYVFLYNEAGAICHYDIDEEEAQELDAKAKELGEYWSSFLGPGGHIWDDPLDENFPPAEGCSNLDLCEEYYKYNQNR